MSKKNLQKAIENPGEQIRLSSNNALGRVYWTLIDKLMISVPAFFTSLNKYVRDPRNVPVQTSHKRSEKNSNISAELTNPDRLSWNKFIEGLKVVEVVRLRVTFEVWRGKREVYAKTVIDTNLSEIQTDDSDSKDNDDD